MLERQAVPLAGAVMGRRAAQAWGRRAYPRASWT